MERGIHVYLAGAVDNAEGFGLEWRRKVSQILKAHNHKPIMPPGLSPGILERPNLKQDLEDKHFLRHNIIIPDLDAMLSSDVILVKACAKCGFGTFAEVSVASWARIPTVLWVSDAPYEPHSAHIYMNLLWNRTALAIVYSMEQAARTVDSMVSNEIG